MIHLVRSALWNDAERRLRMPWRLLVAVVLLLVAGFAVVLVVTTTVGVFLVDLGALEGIAGLTVESVLSTVVVLAVLWIVARYVDRRTVTDYGLDVDDRWWADFAFGLALGAGLQAAIVLVGWLAGWFRITGLFVSEGGFVSAMVVMAVLFLSVGVVEELLVRGWLLTNLAEGLRLTGEWVAVGLAVLLSSVLFGVLHLGNPGASPLSAAIISLAGVFLALGYVLTGELGIPIGVHVTWNFFQGPVFGLGVSGLPVPASVVAVEPVGPEPITGGAFGPEAGLLGVGAILVGSAATALWVRRRDGALGIHRSVTTPDLRSGSAGGVPVPAPDSGS